MSGLDIEGVLAGHEIGHERRAYPAYACLCGWDGAQGDDGSETDGQNDTAEAARAHVAAVLREQIAAWLGSEAAEEAVHEALDPDGYGWAAGDSPSVRETIRALAAQVAPSRVPGEET